MSNEPLPDGPDAEAITHLILETWPETIVAEVNGARFFSLDASNWPNYATIVWTDDFDEGAPSDLARPGVFRVNIGLDKPSFERLVGSPADEDHAAFDRFEPHPVYARQRWVSILNPSQATMRDEVMPLIAEAHDRLAARRRREGGA